MAKKIDGYIKLQVPAGAAMPLSKIVVRGARERNLPGFDVELPSDGLIQAQLVL